MCINDEVKKLKSVQLINDRCLELQKKSGAYMHARVYSINVSIVKFIIQSLGGYIPFYTHNIGGKESSKIIKNNDDEKPPKAKRSRGKKMGSGGCHFYKSTALGNFSDLALVSLYPDMIPII